MSPRAAETAAGVERAVADLIRALGLDPADEPELLETPARVARLYAEAFAGLDPAAEPELEVFPHAPAEPPGGPRQRPGRGERGRPPGSSGEDLVTVRDIPFHSMCVHHLVPFFGRAHVAYVPGERIVGISGPARLVDFYARRPQLQERMGASIADHLERLLAPRGVAVVIEARHLCMEMRGIRKFGRVETRTLRGVLTEARWAEALRTSRGG